MGPEEGAREQTAVESSSRVVHTYRMGVAWGLGLGARLQSFGAPRSGHTRPRTRANYTHAHLCNRMSMCVYHRHRSV